MNLSNNIKLIKIINLVTIVFVFGLSLELCARIDDWIKYDASFWDSYSDQILRSNDENGVRYNIPGVRFEKWEHNSLGFRNPEFDLKKSEDILRIACMGTSETYGLYETPGNEWPAQLSRMLAPYNKYEVINVSTVGLKRENYIKYFEDYVFKIDPDCIIIFINPQLFSKEKNPNIKKISKISVKKSIPFNLNTVRENIRLLPKIRQMVKNFIPLTLLHKYQYWERSKLILEMEKKYLKDKKAIDIISDVEKDRFTNDIIEIIKTLQKRDIDIILCTYPFLITKENIEEHRLLFMESRRFTVELSFDGMIDCSKSADSIMLEVAQKMKTGFIDCNGLIPKNLTYYSDNVHLTNQGAEMIAKLVADYIINHE